MSIRSLLQPSTILATVGPMVIFGILSNVWAQSPGNYVPNELLVKFAAGPASAKARAANAAVGATVLETLGYLGWQRVKVPTGTSLNAATAAYRAMDGAAAVQPNFYYHLLATPNDPQFGNAGMYGLTKIGAPAAWDLSTGSASVVVANIDTGIRYTHEDLAANMWTNPGEISGNGIDDDNDGFIDDIYGADFRYNDADPADEHGHGTHTSGTIGAVGNNSLGVVGVNWNVRLMAIKIYSSTGTDTTSAMLINAYNYVLMMKNRGVNIRVTNNSYGGCNEACGFDQATKDAIDALGNAGILQVFAAGNNGANIDTTPFYPASYTSTSILSVAASDNNDARASFSNYGPTSVDIAAPGVGILSTLNGSDSSYGTLSGTSMATPHVTGAAALLAAYQPALTAAGLKDTLMNTVDVLPAWNGVVGSGGRLNIAKAMNCTYNSVSGAMTMPTKGGFFTVNVAAAPGCSYRISSDVIWIHVVGDAAPTGPASVTFRVNVNAAIRRTGHLLIGGQTLAVTQARN